ncbi:MAG: hypothetical protein WCA59_13965 [Candidatus Binataceae bacterium]
MSEWIGFFDESQIHFANPRLGCDKSFGEIRFLGQGDAPAFRGISSGYTTGLLTGKSEGEDRLIVLGCWYGVLSHPISEVVRPTYV